MNRSTLFKLLFVIIVVILVLNSLITENAKSLPSPPNGDNTFMMGVQTFGYNSTDNNTNDGYNWYRQMPYVNNTFHFNALNFWAGSVTPPYDGGLYDAVNTYSTAVNGFMDYMDSNDKIGLYGRQTFEKLCWAQRSTYQVETGGFYGYDNNESPVTGSVFSDDPYGASGRWADTSTDSPGYLVSGLVENEEQSDNWKYCGAGPEDDSLWYVKPRMRIPQEVAINNPDLLVAQIRIYNFDGSLAKSVDIRANNFLKNNSYDGSYIEEYDPPVDLSISGEDENSNQLNWGAYTIFNGEAYNCDSSKVDYRIWWYGNCDLWVDYVRLDDQWANRLFNPDPQYNWDSKILDEANAFRTPYIFYIDEIRFNNLPAMRYIQGLIKSTNSGASLVALSFPAMNVGLRNKLSNSTPYLDSMTLNSPYSVPKYHSADYYVLNTTSAEGNSNYRCWLPPNLEPVNKSNLNYLYSGSSYTLYTNMLQSRLGGKSGNLPSPQSLSAGGLCASEFHIMCY